MVTKPFLSFTFALRSEGVAIWLHHPH